MGTTRLPLVVALLLVALFVALRPTPTPAPGPATPLRSVGTGTAAPPDEPAARSLRPYDATVAVRGHVYDDRGAPLEQLLVRVRSVDGRARGQDLRTAADGSFRTRVAAPGRWRFEVDSYLHQGAEQVVSVARGDAPVLGLSLRRLPSAGDVSGRLVSESGTYRFPVRVTLAPDGHLPLAERDVHWAPDENGELVGRFVFEDVPWDDYVVRIWPLTDQVCEWTTLEQRARPPATALEFVCLDAAPIAVLEFAPFDVTTGAPIDDFELCLGFDHGLLPAHCRRGSGGSRFEDVWLNRRLRWSLEAQGYEPAAGDLETWAVDRGAECGLERSFPVPLRPKTELGSDTILDARRPSGVAAGPTLVW